jgi:hypothetical protein
MTLRSCARADRVGLVNPYTHYRCHSQFPRVIAAGYSKYHRPTAITGNVPMSCLLGYRHHCVRWPVVQAILMRYNNHHQFISSHFGFVWFVCAAGACPHASTPCGRVPPGRLLGHTCHSATGRDECLDPTLGSVRLPSNTCTVLPPVNPNSLILVDKIKTVQPMPANTFRMIA